MPKTGDTWPLPVLAPKTKVSDIQDIWPKAVETAKAPVLDQKQAPVQTAKKKDTEHFPFASAFADTSENQWPSTSLSFAPTAAAAPGAVPNAKQ
jgi:hypothetical protein